MDKLTFPETAILETAISAVVISEVQWYELASSDVDHEPTTGVIVVATDSTLEFLAGPLNLVERIVVMSDDFNDGRFFSIGRQIRQHGYRRRLTLAGDILPDQYTALRFCGFDDVLILANGSTSRVVVLDNAFALTEVSDPVFPKPEPFTLSGPSQ
jgi:uncharacterized protein (DUF934 family)